nr:MFS transporter [Pseudonocardia alni]
MAAVANAGFLAVALNTATRLVAPGQKGRALAVLLSGTTIAMVAGVPAGALLGAALGWRATFWAVALVCVPAALGILIGIRPRRGATHDESGDGPPFAFEMTQLRVPRLLMAILLAALVNGATFAAFAFLAPIVTGTAGLDQVWVPLTLVLFGIGSVLGVSAVGRLSDQHPRSALLTATPILLLGWLSLALLAEHPVALLVLVLLLGVQAFAVGSILVARVLYAAAEAPTMGGSYATAALNLGAAVGPVLGAAALTGSSNLGPVWVAAALTTLALLVMQPSLHLISPPPTRNVEDAK